jgi:hypothetical protein
MMVMRMLTAFFAPIGINRLLVYAHVMTGSCLLLILRYSYIESRGENALVRPWVWVSLMFLGPFVGTLVMQWYTFLTVRCFTLFIISSKLLTFLKTRSLVRAQAIITQLVFEHSLRIRMKAETSGTPPPSTAPTPDTASLVDASESTEVAEEDAGSQASPSTADETLRASSASTSSKGKQKAASEPEKPEKEDKKDSNLVGKINNLVATDLENIIDGRDFLILSK